MRMMRVMRGMAVVAAVVAGVLLAGRLAGQTTNVPGVAPWAGSSGLTTNAPGVNTNTGGTVPSGGGPQVTPITGVGNFTMLVVSNITGPAALKFTSPGGTGMVSATISLGTNGVMNMPAVQTASTASNAPDGSPVASQAYVNTTSNALQAAIGAGSGTATNYASSNSDGMITSNIWVHSQVSPAARASASFPRPMGFMFNNWMPPVSVFETLAASMTNGMHSAGYTLAQLNQGWNSWLRDGSGNMQMNPTNYAGWTLSGFVQAVQTNGCQLGVQLEMWTTDHLDTDRLQALHPWTSYQDGYWCASAGVRKITVACENSLQDSNQLKYAAESLVNGADRAAFDLSLPGSVFLDWECTDPSHYFPGMPDVANSIYQSSFGDFGNSDSGIWTNNMHLLTTLTNDSYIYGSHCVADSSGFYVAGSQPWLSTNIIRAWMGVYCIAHLPLLVAGMDYGYNPSASVLSIIQNTKAIALYQDQGNPPISFFYFGTNGIALTSRRPNGNVILGLWSWVTNANYTFNFGLTNVIGLSNVVSIQDYYDGQITGATNTITATVTTNGLNLYELSNTGIAVTGITTNFLSGVLYYTYTDGKLVSISPYVWDADATNFLNYIGDGTLTGDATQIAVNNLAVAAKAHGWWTNCVGGIFPMVGSSSNQMGANLYNTNYPMAFGGTGSTFDANGFTGNGSGYGIGTNLVTLGHISGSTNSLHLFVYSGTNDTTASSSVWYWDAENGGNAFTLFSLANNQSVKGYIGFGGGDVSLATPTTVTDYRGPTILSEFTTSGGSASVPTNQAWIACGAIVGTPATPLAYWGTANVNLAMLAKDTIASGYGSIVAGNIRGASVGTYIPQTMWSVMRADWDTFEAALGRKVP